ncbi:MAG: response regulator transcription factor [Planctomycetota bacterium]
MNPTPPIRVYVIDDQAILRAALRRLLSVDCGFDVVGDHGDPRTAVAELEALRPDVVTLDLTMPGLSGVDALPRLQKASPNTRFLVLTNHESGRFLEESLRAGAAGYLTKDSEPEELRVAVESVHAGRNYVTPRVAGALVERLRCGPTETNEASSTGRLAPLTAREREVFQLLALGKSNKEVARELDVSLGTAKKHRENLQRKLDAHSTAELARIAIQEGLLSG